MMISENAKVVAGSFGYAKVFVTVVLDASVKTGGNIAYGGKPRTINKNIATGGSLNEIITD